jgi:pilus assembly protein CpaB
VKRRVLAALGALLLAAVGAVLLMSYVGAADQRAMAGMKTVTVLVVAKPIAEGTSSSDLAGRVKAKTLPAVAVASGSVSDLAQLSGRVATADLVPGEQLLASRFVDPATLRQAGEVKIPAGLQQLSVTLDPQRVLGGHLTAGSTVGVYISLPKDGNQVAQTRLVLHQMLVTRVDGGQAATSTEGVTATPSASSSAAASSVMVTLAATSVDAEKIVFGAEHGTLWLSSEPADADVSDHGVVTAKTVEK